MSDLQHRDAIAAMASSPIGAVYPRPGTYVEAQSAEQLQTAQARAKTYDAFLEEPTTQARQRPAANTTSADLPALQMFPQRPDVRGIVAAARGDELPGLPGRQPPAGWDGETDASAPIVVVGGY